jgi:hypothetical protein
LVKKLRVARERKRELTGNCEGRKSTAEIAPEVVQEIKRLHRRKPGQKRMTYQAIAEHIERGRIPYHKRQAVDRLQRAEDLPAVLALVGVTFKVRKYDSHDT